MYENRESACGPAGQRRGALCRPPPFPSPAPIQIHSDALTTTFMRSLVGVVRAMARDFLWQQSASLGRRVGEEGKFVCLWQAACVGKGGRKRGRRLEVGCYCVTLTNPFCQNVEGQHVAEVRKNEPKNAGLFSVHAACALYFRQIVVRGNEERRIC